MSENKFTAGSWYFEEIHPYDDGLGYIRTDADNLEISHHGDQGRSAAENRANGHLQAASKDMLEALKAVTEALRGRVHSRPALRALEQCDAAIARAHTGES